MTSPRTPTGRWSRSRLHHHRHGDGGSRCNPYPYPFWTRDGAPLREGTDSGRQRRAHAGLCVGVATGERGPDRRGSVVARPMASRVGLAGHHVSGRRSVAAAASGARAIRDCRHDREGARRPLCARGAVARRKPGMRITESCVLPCASALAILEGEQEVGAAFTDHDRGSVGVGAGYSRERRRIGDTEPVHTPDPELLVERAVGLTTHRDGAGRVVRRDRVSP